MNDKSSHYIKYYMSALNSQSHSISLILSEPKPNAQKSY